MRRLALAAMALGAGCGGSCTPLPPCPARARAGCPDPDGERFVDPLRHEARAEGDSFIEILDVVVDFPTVYACTGTQGLTVWDASGSGAPQLLREKVGPAGAADPQFPRCQHIGLDRANERLVLTNRGDEVQPRPFLWLYDVSDPGDPEPLQGWAGDPSIEGAVLHDGRIYAAAHTAGVLVLEDQGLTSLAEIGSYADAESDAWQPVLLDDDHLAVAEGPAGLRTYDVSADDPQLLGAVAFAGSSRDVVVSAGLAYVATSAGLGIADLSDPAVPVVVSETPTLGTSLAVALGLEGTVVAAEWDEIRGYDVSDPTDVRPIFSERVPTDDEFSRVLALDAAPDEARVFAGEWTGMHVFAQRNESIGPDVWASPQSIQFGNVEPGASSDRVMVVRNQGNRPLTVLDVIADARVEADRTCFQVDPGGSSAVELTLSPTSNESLRSALKVCSDDPDEPELFVGLSANVSGRSVGDPMPEFSLRDLDGELWTDADLEGNIAVLAYFATF